MPNEIWTEAVQLATAHGVHRISKALGIGYASLQKRVMKREEAWQRPDPQRGGFIELAGSSFLSGPLPAQTVLELQRSDGTRLALRLANVQTVDMPALVTSFLR